MSYWRKCLSTGDYQYITTGDPAPGDIVVPWWEVELAQKDQRIRTLKEELDGMLSVNDNANRRIAELEEQLPAVVEVSFEPIQKNVTGWNVHRCSCGQVVSADGLWKFCPSCGSKLKWEKV